ncbi:hypothetical protein GCM10010377_55140 [Streptomyces viridiviolaceus]|nr:hypothetical protein GCM10010377_55140 [Streptomyces viridiviolaceus]
MTLRGGSTRVPGNDYSRTIVVSAVGRHREGSHVDAPLYVRPGAEPPLARLLTDWLFLHSIVDTLGSPFNVLIPEAVAENAARFRAVYRRHRLTGRVYFAHKADRSSALLR